MTVQQRRAAASQLFETTTNRSDRDESKRKMQSPRRSIQIASITTISVLVAAYMQLATRSGAGNSIVGSGPTISKLKIDGQNHLLLTRRLSLQAELQVHLSRDSEVAAATDIDHEVLLGPHTVIVTIDPSCAYPRFFLRAQGDALAHILLKETPDKRQWHGSFYLPTNGSYSIDARWYGCNLQDTRAYSPLAEPLSFQAKSDSLLGLNENADYYAGKLLAKSTAWTSTKKIRIGDTPLPPYIWRNVNGGEPEPGSFVKTTESLVHQGGALGPDGYYDFGEVGNYELVCFMGSDTMHKIWRAFMDMRGHLFAHQRPFKFHFYDIYSFTKPDEHWEEDTKQRLRKCKHILLALDEFKEQLSQHEYREQVVRFVNFHLQNVIPDKTFPIWVFSVNEPPMNTTNCFNPILPRTTDHPCNDVLNDLFRPGVKIFDDRIHILDNTDLSLPQFDMNQADVLASIALRVYVIVGKGVSIWRHMGQSGKIDGLHRNGTVEPNFELVAYEGWSNR